MADRNWFRRRAEGQESREDLLERLAFASLVEARRRRRWGNFFKFLGFIYLSVVLVAWWPRDMEVPAMPTERYTALVEVRGLIAEETDASAERVMTALRSAFEDSHAAGVIVRINSPGGSAVQAGEIYDEIRRLREKHPGKKLYAVITDMGASGGYYIASAADAIYADKASIVGSIGVIMNSFGFVDAMDKLGVERRLFTAGEHKALLDPFTPLDPVEADHIRTMLEEIHAQFIDSVKAGRGDRLKDDPQLFSGLVWSGEQALALGLVDGLGSAGYVAREVIGAEKLVDFTVAKDLIDQFLERFGLVMANLLWSQGAPGALLAR